MEFNENQVNNPEMENFEKRENTDRRDSGFEGLENSKNYSNYNPYPPQRITEYIPFGFTPETYKEKKDIRKSAMNIGIPLLLMFGISMFWATVYYAVMAVFGFTPEGAYEIISEPAVLSVAQIILSVLMFTVPFVLSTKIAGYRISDLAELEKPEKNTVLPFFLFGISFCAFANISVSYAGSIFESFGINYSVDFGDNPQGIFGFLLSLLATVAVPALVEEFTCRGIIFGILKKYGEAFALIVSSIIFGVMHGNFSQIPFAFLVGLVLGYIRIKTGSLWVCCLVHAFNNLISVLFDYFASGLPVMAQNIMYTVFLMLCLLAGIVGILLLSKHPTDNYKLKNAENACEEKQKYKWFFSSPFIIIFLILFLAEACLYFVN